jgi:hypothetical protein
MHGGNTVKSLLLKCFIIYACELLARVKLIKNKRLMLYLYGSNRYL